MPSFDAFYAWSKDWQVLIAGLLAVFAACIFAVGAVTAARISAGAQAKVSNPDLRAMATAANDHAEPELVAPAIGSALDQLRWLIRSALSPQLFGKSSHESVSRCCERIFQLKLETSPLPADAPDRMKIQRKAILRDISALRELIDRQAASSEITSALIKLNGSAREMASLLGSVGAPPPSVTSSGL